MWVNNLCASQICVCKTRTTCNGLAFIDYNKNKFSVNTSSCCKPCSTRERALYDYCLYYSHCFLRRTLPLDTSRSDNAYAFRSRNGSVDTIKSIERLRVRLCLRSECVLRAAQLVSFVAILWFRIGSCCRHTRKACEPISFDALMRLSLT